MSRARTDVDGAGESRGVAKSKSMTVMSSSGQKNLTQSQSYSHQEKAVSQFQSISADSSSFTQYGQETKSISNSSSSRMPVAGDGRLASSTAAEADIFLEELMEEAKKDPSFGVVPGLNKANDAVDNAKAEKKERGAIERFNYAAAHENTNDSRPGSAQPAPDSYAFVPRPYRTAQDMIIRDKSAERGREAVRVSHQDKHAMPKRPYRTATDFKIEDSSNRSRSADGRFKPYAERDPRFNNYMRSNSSENMTSDIMQEVVTDQKHRSVKDLVAKLETSTKSESENPYVRKWGCDLISPEPRRRDKTYRFQKKQMPDPEFQHRLQYSMSDYGTGSRVGSRNRNLSETSHDSHEPFLENYTADIDDLVERQHGEQDIDLVFQDISGREVNNNYSAQAEDNKQEFSNDASYKAVEWPPKADYEASNIAESKTENFVQKSSSQSFTQNNVSSNMNYKQTYNNEDTENQSKKKKVKKSKEVTTMNQKNSSETKMTNGTRKYDRNSLCELDAQIMSIQTQFESELDSLIGPYTKIFQSVATKNISFVLKSRRLFLRRLLNRSFHIFDC